VVYPSRGVAEVVEIVEKEIGGRVQRFYLLTLLDGRSHILVPVERCGDIGLRDVVGQEEVAKIFELLSTPCEPKEREPWTRRLRGFSEKIRSGNIFDLAEVLRDLSNIAAQKPLSFGERHLFETTRKLLVQELSIARGMSSERIDRQVSRILLEKDRPRH
jgi:CarD family transcriptional regulator